MDKKLLTPDEFIAQVPVGKSTGTFEPDKFQVLKSAAGSSFPLHTSKRYCAKRTRLGDGGGICASPCICERR